MEKFMIDGPGYRISGRFHPPATEPPWRLVVNTHGLFSSMDSEKHTRVARELSEFGFAVAVFDCQGTGLTGGLITRTTLSGRVEELQAVRDHFLADGRISGRPILMGSSFGGSSSLLAGARDGAKAVVSWSAPCDYSALEDHRDDLEEPMEDIFFEDLAAQRIPEEVRGLTPVLVIHGEKDETVPVDQAFTLAEVLGPDTRLVVIKGADHSLTTPGAVDLAMTETKEFIKRFLT